MTFIDEALVLPMNGPHPGHRSGNHLDPRAWCSAPPWPSSPARRPNSRSTTPQPGWVEHDPEDLWRTALSTAREAMATAGLDAGSDIAAIGIANQRETTVVWDRRTGLPGGQRAIVWQDRRTVGGLRGARAPPGHGRVGQPAGPGLKARDPYFSATKIAWILDNVEGARARAEAGDLAFGTVDSFLLWRLTDGQCTRDRTPPTHRAHVLCDIRHGPVGPGSARTCSASRPACCRRSATAPASFGTTTVLGGDGPRSAGSPGTSRRALDRPGLPVARHGQGDVRHGGLRAAATSGDTAGPVQPRHADHHRDAARRACAATPSRATIFSAGTGVQWLRDGLGLIQPRDPDGRPGRSGRPRRTHGVSGAGVHRPSAPRTGTATPARPSAV